MTDKSERRNVPKWVAGAVLALAAGCATTPPYNGARPAPLLTDPLRAAKQEPATNERADVIVQMTATDAAAVSANQARSLDQLVHIALANHPDLAVAATKAETARGLMVQAGLCPNPMIGWMADDVGDKQKALGKQGFIVSQKVITANKLQIAQAAAGFGVAAADWNAITQRFTVITRVRTSYFDVLTAQREVKENEALVKLAEKGVEVAKKTENAGFGARPDVLRAEIELNQSRVRLQLAQQRTEAAWRMLATAIGQPSLPATALDGDLNHAAPDYAFDPVQEAVLHRSSEIHAANAALLQAQEQLRRAQVEPHPDITFQVRPFYSFPQDRMNAGFEVTAEIPIFNKNQGHILAAQAHLAQAGQMVKQTELQLTDRLTAAFQRYESARQQKATYEKIILQADESLRLVTIGYQAGDAKFDYTAVLQAQQTLAQARLAHVQTLGDLWRAASDIAGLLQIEELK